MVSPGDAFRLERLEAVFAERKARAALGDALDPALVGLAEFGLDRLQHDGSGSSIR